MTIDDLRAAIVEAHKKIAEFENSNFYLGDASYHCQKLNEVSPLLVRVAAKLNLISIDMASEYHAPRWKMKQEQIFPNNITAEELKQLEQELKAAELEQQAEQRRKQAQESFDRCDTDGFLSQWASGLTAQMLDRQAQIERDGGMAEFYRLNDLEGNEVPAKLINGKFGLCWALVDAKGNFIGKFVSAHPSRESTMTKKGYREVKVMRPAKAVIKGSGHGLSGNAWVGVIEVEGN